MNPQLTPEQLQQAVQQFIASGQVTPATQRPNNSVTIPATMNYDIENAPIQNNSTNFQELTPEPQPQPIQSVQQSVPATDQQSYESFPIDLCPMDKDLVEHLGRILAQTDFQLHTPENIFLTQILRELLRIKQQIADTNRPEPVTPIQLANDKPSTQPEPVQELKFKTPDGVDDGEEENETEVNSDNEENRKKRVQQRRKKVAKRRRNAKK